MNPRLEKKINQESPQENNDFAGLYEKLLA